MSAARCPGATTGRLRAADVLEGAVTGETTRIRLRKRAASLDRRRQQAYYRTRT